MLGFQPAQPHSYLYSKHHLPLWDLGASRFATLCEEGVVLGRQRQAVSSKGIWWGQGQHGTALHRLSPRQNPIWINFQDLIYKIRHTLDFGAMDPAGQIYRTTLKSQLPQEFTYFVSLPPIRGKRDKQQSSKFSVECLYLTSRVGSWDGHVVHPEGYCCHTAVCQEHSSEGTKS